MDPGEGAISVGEEDQRREAEMEIEQRRQDEHWPPPSPARRRRGSGRRRGPEKEEPWQGRADEAGHPGQTDEGGLGGSGPVQPS